MKDQAGVESWSLMTTKGATASRYGEAAESIHGNSRMVAAQISLEQDEHTSIFGSGPEQRERSVWGGLCVVLDRVQTVSEYLAQSLRGALSQSIHAATTTFAPCQSTHERQGISLALRFQDGSNHALPTPNIADQGIDQGIRLADSCYWKRAKVGAMITPRWWRG